MTKFEQIAIRCGVYPGSSEPTLDALVAMVGALEERIFQVETALIDATSEPKNLNDLPANAPGARTAAERPILALSNKRFTGGERPILSLGNKRYTGL